MASIKGRGSEAIAQIAGLLLIGAALHKSYRVPDFDPMPLVGAGTGLITLVWMLPTEAFDRRIEDVIEKVDKDL